MGTVQWRMNGKTVLCYCSCWGLVCDLPPHGVSVVQSRKVWSKNCNWNLLHHRSEAVHQTEHAGLGLIKYKNLSSAMTNSRVWLGNGIQFPSLRRKQVLAPVVLLSHYASCALKVEPAPVNIPQRLSKKQKCRRKRRKNAVVKYKRSTQEMRIWLTFHKLLCSVPSFVHTYYLLTERF